MGIERKRPRYPPTQGPFQNEIHRIQLRQFEMFDCSEIYEKTWKIQSSVIFAEEITLAQRTCSPVM